MLVTKVDLDEEAINIHIGKRIRRRRRLLGATQQQLAEAVGIRYQQIHKYECGANRVVGARLYQIGVVLRVPMTYFFEGLLERNGSLAPQHLKREMLEVERVFETLSEQQQGALLKFAKELQEKRAPVVE